KYVSSSESSQVSSGSWRACTSYLARIGTLNRGGFVAQAFELAGSGDFPVARSWSTGLESPVNPQAGKPALQAGSGRGRAVIRLLVGDSRRVGEGAADRVAFPGIRQTWLIFAWPW